MRLEVEGSKLFTVHSLKKALFIYCNMIPYPKWSSRTPVSIAPKCNVSLTQRSLPQQVLLVGHRTDLKASAAAAVAAAAAAAANARIAACPHTLLPEAHARRGGSSDAWRCRAGLVQKACSCQGLAAHICVTPGGAVSPGRGGGVCSAGCALESTSCWST